MESELAVRSGVSFHNVSFISPDTSVPKQVGRHTREAYVDPKTNLIYVTDGNGGGGDRSALHRADASAPRRLVLVLRRGNIGAAPLTAIRVSGVTRQ